MKIADLKNKKVLILGLGREGLATLQYLSKLLPEQKFSVADKQQIPKQVRDDKMVDEVFELDEHLKHLSEFDVVIKSPGISHLIPEIKKAQELGVIFTSATNIFFEQCPGKIIGVTGTKGKSTTASLIYEILKTGGVKVKLVGNIGIPALQSLQDCDQDTHIVFELSSHQLYDITSSPHIAVLTNIYPEHLDYYTNFTEYVSAKANITKFQTDQDYLVYNNAFPELVEIAKSSKAKLAPFSLEGLLGSVCFLKGDQTICNYRNNEFLIDNDEIPLTGIFNLQNVMAAVIVGMLLKVTNEDIKKGIAGFKPLPHRLEYVGQFNDINFYNDSLATVPQTAVAALTALPDVQTLIAGGFDRGLDYSMLGKAIVASGIKNLILFPTTGEKIWEAVECRVKSAELRVKKFEVSSMEEAVRIAYEQTTPGKTVLLSPASSSFNMFKDYEDRGNQFKKYVLEFK